MDSQRQRGRSHVSYPVGSLKKPSSEASVVGAYQGAGRTGTRLAPRGADRFSYQSRYSSVREGAPSLGPGSPGATSALHASSPPPEPSRGGYLYRSRAGTTSGSAPAPAVSRGAGAASSYTPSRAEPGAPRRRGASLEPRGVAGARIARASPPLQSSSDSSSDAASDDTERAEALSRRSRTSQGSELPDRMRELSVTNKSRVTSAAAPGTWASGSSAPDRGSLDWARRLPHGSGVKGLANLGNTCYMNSILQCLFATPEVVRHFTGSSPSPAEAPVAAAFADLVSSAWGGGGACVTPRKFLERVIRKDSRWSGDRQQDSMEFLQFLLGAIRSEVNRVKGKPKYEELKGKGTVDEQAAEAWQYARKWYDSVVDDIFGGMLQSTVICGECEHASYCFDPFLDLSLQIAGRTGGCSVTDCLSAFTEVEILKKTDGYRCERCKRVVKATKQLQIYRLPKVLIVHLKRFSSSSGLGRFSSFSKNNNSVRITSRGLNFTPYCNPVGAKEADSLTFDLIGVSNHSGGLGGGHYTAVTWNFKDKKWYNYNDSHATGTREPEGSSQSAYVLFYRRRD